MIPRMWTEDPFSHAGEFYNVRRARSSPSQCRTPIRHVDGVQPAHIFR